MKTVTQEDLLNIYKREQQYLVEAIKNGSDPHHFFSLSTIRDNNAESRMIVLRDVTLSPFKIFFNCDIRSPKANQLQNQNNCTALFYNQERRIQMRLKCNIYLHYNNKLSKKVWENTPFQSRKCYMGSLNPSSELKAWDPNVPPKYIDRDPNEEDSYNGYNNFMHVELEIMYCDILELHYNGHIRFGINNKNKIIFLAP